MDHRIATRPAQVDAWRNTRYRVGQFFAGFRARVSAEESELAADLLPAGAAALFDQMPVDAQRHSLNVFYTLRGAGFDQPDLLAAALLHDVGKTATGRNGARLTLWWRGPLVLAETISPRILRRLAKESGTGWRHLIHIHLEHARIGAEWARLAGCSPLTCWLIETHQAKAPTEPAKTTTNCWPLCSGPTAEIEPSGAKMAKASITIIGLGVTGASLGLALQRQETSFEIVGHDKEMDAAHAARKQGAVNRTEWNLFSACEDASLIVLAVPLGEVGGLFELLADTLEPGTMILTLSSVMQPVIDLAARHLPEHKNFIVAHPILSGIGGALQVRGDLFDDVVFALAPGLQTDPNAIQLASDFVARVNAQPLFVDALEHDGIMAGVEHLPLMMAVSLTHTLASAPSWREAKKLAGRRFAQASDMGDSTAQLYGALHANRANLLLRIRQLREDLAEWQELLEVDPPEGEEHPLMGRLKEVIEARRSWATQAMLKNWDDAPEPQEKVESSGLFRQMFFGNLMNRRGSPGREEKK
ncbi:MAG: prephenate dehydrogenase/arogenate dehydrogenase family protein [Caldilineaceae bacterium]|nr:prephenate dehydrogenase/arogenate dehydrogenase family protein [Caldilineaceae bacterium]